MNLLDFIVLAAAIVGVAAYVCRLDSLRVRRHSLVVIGMHLGHAVACIFAGFHAWDGDAGPLDVAAVVAALAWIWISLPTWGSGVVPQQFHTRPGALGDAELRQVSGGRGDV